MTNLKLEYCNLFPEDGPGWYAGEMPDGRRVHAVRMACSPGQLHWAGSVEDPSQCDCDRSEGRCTFCRIRDDGDVVFTKVTGCYRSANSAVRALQHWAANPDSPPQPARWQCPWTAMRSLLCGGEPNAPALPLGPAMYVDGLGSRPTAEICKNDHMPLLIACMEADAAPFECPVCGKLPRFGTLSDVAPQGSDERYGVPALATREWIVEHSTPGLLGLVPIPAARRGGLFTHVEYYTDCDHEDVCPCEQDESVTWYLDQLVAVNIEVAERNG